MDPRNCGLCMACGSGNYERCTTFPAEVGTPVAVPTDERAKLTELLLTAMEWGRDYWTSFSMRGDSQRDVAEQFAGKWLAAQRLTALPDGEVGQPTERDEFTEGVNAAAAMLDKMADDYAAEHSTQDPDTGTWEFGRHGEDYYNTLRELADGIRDLVHGNQGAAK